MLRPIELAVLTSSDSWYYQDLCRASESLEMELTALPFSQIHTLLDPGQADSIRSGLNELDAFDAVLVRSMPPGSLEHVIFRMDCLQQLAVSMLVVNSPKAMEVAIDKYLSLSRLNRAGVNVPGSFVAQSAEHAMEGFAELGGEAVVKPIFGGEGRGLMHVFDEDLAWRTFKTLEKSQSVIYLQRKINHDGSDLRILLVGDKHFAVKRINHSDWRTNVRRGGIAVPTEATAEQIDLAVLTQRTCDCAIAGVDIVVDRDSGENFVIEINAVPGWRGLSKALNIDVAAEVLNFLIDQVAITRK